MKSFLSSPIVRVLVAVIGVAAIAYGAEQLWTCGMHPQIIKKQPGNCPICGMALTPVRANTAGGSAVGGAPGAENAIQIDAVTIQRMNLKTEAVTRGAVKREIRTVGAVAFDERSLHDITTKYEGWIEKLHVNATWTAVKAGQPLFEIYSPDLYNAQLNYVVALRAEGKESGPLTRAALARLKLYDLAPEFIEEVVRSGEARRTYVFHAPINGVVIEKMAVAGQMMKPGERIFRLADLSHVWVHAQIYENDLPLVRPGQPAIVRATYGRDREIKGEVALILPQVEEQTRTATARIVLPNPERDLRPGMFVDVRFSAQLAESAVLVPEIAVLRSGERNTVFLARKDGSFEPREVKLGARTKEGRYEVLEGLAEGDRVVTSGQFMLDSESQLREAIQKMMKTDATAAGSATPADMQKSETPGARTPPADPALLTPLVLAVSDAAAALAADNLAEYQKQLPAVRAALVAYVDGDPNAAKGPLAKLKDALPDRSDIKTAREDFAKLSTAVTDLARANNLHQTAKLHVFECPMAPAVGKGRWTQRTAELKNPFFGKAMLTCGQELK